MNGDGGALDRDIAEQLEDIEQDLFVDMKWDYKNKEFYSASPGILSNLIPAVTKLP